ncbi:MAG: TetR/AcrR family transcriptional regulator [Opitutaceae bacterium]|jgi:AcrR family transcriptional regulator
MDPDKKQRIMQAAERLFRMRRVHEITLDEIAREADVGKGTLYLYFTDKDDLIFQAAVAGFDRMCLTVRENAAPGVAFRQTLLRTCETISGFFQQRRPLFRIILSEGDRDMEGGGVGLRQRWRERRRPMTEAVAAILSQGMASGDVRKDVPAEVLAEYLLGILRTRSWELQDRPEAERSLAGVADIFMNGAGPGARATPAAGKPALA